MTTRSGASYHTAETVRNHMADEERNELAAAATMGELLRFLAESQERRAADERRREEERERRDEEERRREEEERRGRLQEERIRREESERQLEVMARMLERTNDRRAGREPRERDVQLVRLVESNDIATYLTTFERTMGAYEVDKARWAFKLAPYLSGRAQQAYASLTAEEAAEYETLNATILRRYDITEETYRQKFRGLKKEASDSYKELSSKLLDTARKWLQECRSVEEVMDAVVRKQLLSNMPTSLQIWVRERKPKSSKEASDMADCYVQARGEGAKEETAGMRRKVTCFRCEAEGHGAGQCRKGLEEKSVMRKDKRSLGGSKEVAVKCYNCNRIGHLARHCPDSAMFVSSTRRPCGSGGPDMGVLRNGVVEGKYVKGIMLDTGCSRTMVRRNLVPKTKWLEEEVVIRCAHGDTVSYPLAWVELNIDGVPITVEAALSNTLPSPVLLGRDVPELSSLLNRGETRIALRKDDAMVVTRAGAQGEALTTPEEPQVTNEAREKVSVTEIEGQAEDKEKTMEGDPELLGSTFDQELFQRRDDTAGPQRRRLTRAQKRADRRNAKQEESRTYSNEEAALEGLHLSAMELKEFQDADETLKVLRLLARKGDPRFIWKNSLLYRKERRKELGEKDVEQLILPRQCRKVVLKLGHEAPLAGHMGRNKTLCRVLQRFYWPNIYGDVAEWCRSCPNCQKTHNRKTPPVPLIPLPIMTEPFSRIAMDIVGPVLRSRRGHRFTLVVCDYATRYPEAIPLRSCKAETVAEELLKMFARVGIPREILTDQGSNFTSRLLGELYAMLKVHPIRTTPYHLQTDGLVERFNQTWKAMLRRTVDQEGKDWDRLIPFLLFAYREVPQVSTGYSPFELLYGRMVRGPLDVVKEAWESEQAEQSGVEESVVSYVLSIQEKLNQMAGLVRANMEKAQATQKHWYDRKSRERALNEGDKVLVLLPTSNDKLLAQWQGPYVVRRKVNDVNYEIDLGSRKRKRFRLFHINMLRRWYETNSFVEEEA